MDPELPDDERLFEAIEACRPGSDDVHDPELEFLAAELAARKELRDLYRRVQQVDAAVGRAFVDVPVTEGLQQRLLARLADARQEAADLAKPIVAGDPSDAGAAASKRRLSRRQWLSLAGGLSAAATLLVAASIHLHRARAYTESAVLEDARAFFIADAPGSGALLSDVDRQPPSEFPLSRGLARISGIRWREISGLLGRNGVAYDMPGGRAALYVVRRQVSDLPSRPPVIPSLATGGYSASAWQNGDLLYVLVVRGNVRTYRDYITPPGPLT